MKCRLTIRDSTEISNHISLATKLELFCATKADFFHQFWCLSSPLLPRLPPATILFQSVYLKTHTHTQQQQLTEMQSYQADISFKPSKSINFAHREPKQYRQTGRTTDFLLKHEERSSMYFSTFTSKLIIARTRSQFQFFYQHFPSEQQAVVLAKPEPWGPPDNPISHCVIELPSSKVGVSCTSSANTDIKSGSNFSTKKVTAVWKANSCERFMKLCFWFWCFKKTVQVWLHFE